MSILDAVLRQAASDWRFTKTEGMELSGGEGINIGATGGRVYLKQQSTGNTVRLVYAMMGAGFGAALLPIDANAAAPLFPSNALGTVYKGGMSLGRELQPTDFEGFCTIVSGSVVPGAVTGFGISVFFMGQVLPMEWFLVTPSVLFGMALGGGGASLAGMTSALVGSSRAVSAWGGMQAAIFASAGVMVYKGRLGILV